MHRFRSGIAGMVLAVAVAGCGSTVDEGVKPFTPTDTKPFDAISKEMQTVTKNKSHLQKAVPPEEKKKEGGKKS
jgi:hypothetical protein